MVTEDQRLTGSTEARTPADPIGLRISCGYDPLSHVLARGSSPRGGRIHSFIGHSTTSGSSDPSGWSWTVNGHGQVSKRRASGFYSEATEFGSSEAPVQGSVFPPPIPAAPAPPHEPLRYLAEWNELPRFLVPIRIVGIARTSYLVLVGPETENELPYPSF
ncbi:hypothetical protein SUGI_1224770 [Cryptomeria japonica]|uniref:Uncharacterized protein n=1 Tax=Cryptomeria japonica TaxID=3369 RepID=A0AAD3RME4_CRYJA|nr:hypothetical protein SUGI_1224770 [Cryptomeria japonica]